MANYKQTAIAGDKYNRASIVRFNNHQGAIPSVDINEEEVIALADNTVIKRDVAVLHEAFEATKTFRLVDPLTGALGTTTMTHLELFTILHGLYLTLGDLRDNPVAPIAPTATGVPGVLV